MKKRIIYRIENLSRCQFNWDDITDELSVTLNCELNRLVEIEQECYNEKEDYWEDYDLLNVHGQFWTTLIDLGDGKRNEFRVTEESIIKYLIGEKEAFDYLNGFHGDDNRFLDFDYEHHGTSYTVDEFITDDEKNKATSKFQNWLNIIPVASSKSEFNSY